ISQLTTNSNSFKYLLMKFFTKIAASKRRPVAFSFRLLMILVLCLSVGRGWGQTPVPMSTQPGLSYTENFSDIANWTDNFASGTGASRWGSVATNATGAIPDGVKITSSTATFQTSGTSTG